MQIVGNKHFNQYFQAVCNYFRTIIIPLVFFYSFLTLRHPLFRRYFA